MEQAYFVTVDWCSKGRRGIFCNSEGQGFRKDEPHTEEEIFDILGPFSPILAPQSDLFTVEQIAEFTYWIPLAEYSRQFGIAVKSQST